MTDYVATRTGDRVRVKLSTGWMISHDDDARLADIIAPSGALIGAVQVVEWHWVPPEGGASHPTRKMQGHTRPRSATVETLTAALVEYVRDHDDPAT